MQEPPGSQPSPWEPSLASSAPPAMRLSARCPLSFGHGGAVGRRGDLCQRASRMRVEPCRASGQPAQPMWVGTCARWHQERHCGQALSDLHNMEDERNAASQHGAGVLAHAQPPGVSSGPRLLALLRPGDHEEAAGAGDCRAASGAGEHEALPDLRLRQAATRDGYLSASGRCRGRGRVVSGYRRPRVHRLATSSAHLL
jgi:hypothetical protein